MNFDSKLQPGVGYFWDNFSDYFYEIISNHEIDTNFFKFLFRSSRTPKVLDVGAGRGRFSVPLAQRGANVTAIDIDDKSLDILADASSKENPIDLIRCDFLKKDFSQFRSYFDFALVLGGTLLMMNKKMQIDLISKVFSTIKDNGFVIIDTYNSNTLRKMHEINRRSIFDYGLINNSHVVAESEYLSLEDALIIEYKISDSKNRKKIVEKAYLLDSEEIEKIAIDSGFEVYRKFSDWRSFEYIDDSAGLIFILKKK